MNTKLLKDALSAFLHAQLGEISAKTRQWYQSMLSSLVESYGDMEVSAVTPDHIRDWREKLANAGLSTHSIHGHLRAARRLFNWLMAEGIVESNPANRLRLPRLSVGIPKAMAANDLQTLLDHCSKQASKRDFAIIAFLADTGCRVGGAAGLMLPDLYLDEGVAYVTEKGNRSRPVFFGGYTYTALVVYLAERTDDNPALWMGKFGPLTAHGIYLMLRRRAKEAGVEGRVNPHSLRHAFAREYLRNGGDLATLGRILGHAPGSPITAEYYAVFAGRELKQFHTKFSPLREIAQQSISHVNQPILRD